MLVEDCNVSSGGLFCQSGSHPLQDGELLADTLVLSEFIDFLGAVLVETDRGVLCESQLVLQTMVFGLRDVDFGHSHLAFELSAQ